MGVTDNQIFQIVVACAVPFIGAFISSFWVYDGTVLGTFIRPAMNWIFGPLWTIIYIAMGYASYRVWKAGGGSSQMALLMYMIQLILSWSWPPILYLFQLVGLPSLHFYVFLAFVVLTAILFYQVDNIAGFIFIPYIVWIIFGAFFKH